jgi:hypothetical protein
MVFGRAPASDLACRFKAYPEHLGIPSELPADRQHGRPCRRNPL